MAEGGSGLRVRLQRAALELFHERGYDRTTAAAIASRAGVTERTFFRQFPDKREVLFDGEVILRAALTEAIADAPAGLGPLDLLFHSFRSVLPMLEANRGFAKPRQDLIAATPALQERELAKIEVLTKALAAALQARGVVEATAELAAQIGMAAFVHATIAWLDNPDPSLPERFDHAVRGVKALVVDLAD